MTNKQKLAIKILLVVKSARWSFEWLIGLQKSATYMHFSDLKRDICCGGVKGTKMTYTIKW